MHSHIRKNGLHASQCYPLLWFPQKIASAATDPRIHSQYIQNEDQRAGVGWGEGCYDLCFFLFDTLGPSSSSAFRFFSSSSRSFLAALAFRYFVTHLSNLSKA